MSSVVQMSSATFSLLLECFPVNVSRREKFVLIGTLFAIGINWGKSVPINLNSPYIQKWQHIIEESLCIL